MIAWSRGFFRLWILGSIGYSGTTIAMHDWWPPPTASRAVAFNPTTNERIVFDGKQWVIPDCSNPSADNPKCWGAIRIPDSQWWATDPLAKPPFDPTKPYEIVRGLDLSAVPNDALIALYNKQTQTEWRRRIFRQVSLVGVPPLLTLIAGIALAWVVRGFQRQ